MNKRLKKIADSISKGSVIVDIGSDHAYLLKYLFDNGIVEKSYATEIAKGPYEVCKKNLQGYDSEVFLMSGIKGFNEGVDTAVIAGMGAFTIIDILKDSIEKFRSIEKIILQPMQNIYDLRIWLFQNDFRIVKENYIFDNKHYCILEVQSGKSQEYDFLLGSENIVYDEEYKSYLKNELRLRENLVKKVPSERKKHIMDEINRLSERIISLKY